MAGMTRSVRFLPEALVDLLETRHWTSRREPGLGQTFAEAIAGAIGLISTCACGGATARGVAVRLGRTSRGKEAADRGPVASGGGVLSRRPRAWVS